MAEISFFEKSTHVKYRLTLDIYETELKEAEAILCHLIRGAQGMTPSQARTLSQFIAPFSALLDKSNE